MAVLNEKLEQLRILQEKLAELTEKLEETENKKRKLEEEVESCSNKLVQAEKLIGTHNLFCVKIHIMLFHEVCTHL